MMDTILKGASDSMTTKSNGSHWDRLDDQPIPLDESILLWSSLNDSTAYSSNDSFVTVPENIKAHGRCDYGFNYFRWFVYTCCVAPMVVLGILGNLAAFVILWRKYRRIVLVLLLFVFTFIDTLLLVLMGIIHCWLVLQQCYGVLENQHYYMVMYRMCYPLVYIIRMSGMGISVLLSWKRWIVVCRPFEAKQRLQFHSCLFQIILVILFASLFSIPRFFELHMQNNVVRTTSLLTNKAYNIIYRSTGFSLVMYICPMLFIVWKCSGIIRALRVSERCRKLSTTSNSRSPEVALENRITICLLILTLVCNTPALITHLHWSISYMHELFTIRYQKYLSVISNLAIAVSSSSNIVIYCWFGPEFRKEFSRMCVCFCRHLKRGNPNHLSLEYSTTQLRSNPEPYNGDAKEKFLENTLL